MYGMNNREMEDMWNGMGILTQRLTVWPDPRHLLAEGMKLYHIKILTESSSSLGHSYPRTMRVSPNRTCIQEIKNRSADAVLKREFSSQGKHVFTPHTGDADLKLSHALRMERVAYADASFPTPAWFIQPYVAPLLYLGEVQAFIVNGTLFSTVVTTPSDVKSLDTLETQEAVLFTPLSQLRSVRLAQLNFGVLIPGHRSG
jgi:hypothetical protein